MGSELMTRARGHYAAFRALDSFPELELDNIVIVGGSLLSMTPRDIDVMLVGWAGNVFDLAQRPVTNSYGGAKFLPFDVWRLEDSKCFIENPELEVTIENFVRAIPDGYPKIAYHVGLGVLYK